MTQPIRLCAALFVFIASSVSSLHGYTVPEMKAMEAKVERLVAKNLPAVVALIGESVPGAGSGTLVSADGLILTAAHVTRGNTKMTVVFPDGHSVKCTVLGANYTRDVGLAKTDDAGPYPFVEIGDSDQLAASTMVVALGHPGGFDLRRPPPARIGRINMANPGGFVMSDCTLVGGDSGGPLFDLDGKLVAIHSSISEALTFNRHAPVNAAKADWKKLLASERWGTLPGSEHAERQGAMLGAVLDLTTQNGAGLKEVPPRSPAGEAGLKAGDVIVRFNGRVVKDAAQLRSRLRRSQPGRQVELVYQRAGANANASVTLVSAEELNQRLAGGKDVPPRAAARDDNPPARPAATNPLAELLDKLRAKRKTRGGIAGLELGPGEFEGMLRELLEKQGIPKDTLKSAILPDLLRLTNERFSDAIQGVNFEGFEPLRELLALTDPKLQGKLEDQYRGMLDGHRPGCGAAAKATVMLRDGKKPQRALSFGTGVQADGWLLTKASEVAGARKLQCQVHGAWLAAKVAHTWQEHDLALVKIATHDLPVVTWSDQSAPPVGALIAAVAPEGNDPAAIGLVSVAARCQQEKGRGFLGVQLDADASGIKIRAVVPGGAAFKSGVQRDDRVLAVDDTKPDSILMFTTRIAAHHAGETVKLKLQRGDEVLDKEIALDDRASGPGARPAHGEPDKMEAMGSILSKRKDDFANVMQSDFPLDANQCGGPVADLDGNVVGLVIARSGRVETLLLPSATLRDALGSIDFAKEAAGLAQP